MPKLKNDYATNLVLGALLGEGLTAATSDDDFKPGEFTLQTIPSTLLSPFVGNGGGLIRNLGIDLLGIDPRTILLTGADGYVDSFREGTPEPGWDLPSGNVPYEPRLDGSLLPTVLAADATKTIIWPSENPGREFFNADNQKRAINKAIDNIGQTPPAMFVDGLRDGIKQNQRNATGIPYNTLNDSDLKWEVLDGWK